MNELSKKIPESHESLILVKGDISGIQEFIFNVKSKRAAQSLKGRSFFVKILAEVAIQCLFDKFNVPVEKRREFRISTSGGNFYIKLPSASNPDVLITSTQLSLTKSLRYSGLNLSLNFVELVDSEYCNCLQNLNKKVRESKLKLYAELSIAEFEEIFAPKDKELYTRIDNNEYWIPITERVKSSRYFTISQGNFRQDLKLNQDSIELMGYRCLFHNTQTESQKIQLDNYLESIFPSYIEGKKQGQTIEFEDLARKKGCGAEKLGILKMDVDNLGTNLEKLTSIEEHKSFDEELRKFFNSVLKEIIYSEFENEIYTVTAGGDDSFFVGNWRIILELAEKIQSKFSNYPYFRSKDLTISAGYIIVSPKFPVVRFSQLAENAIQKAKYKYSKGNICIFDEVVSWNLFKETQEFKAILGHGVSSKSKGLLAKARQSAIRGIEDDVVTLKENWEMSYFLRDCDKQDVVEKIRTIIKANLNKSVTIQNSNAINQLNKRAYRLILPIAARLKELEMRN